MNNSIKQQIISFLSDDQFVWAGKIDDHIRSVNGSKASNVSRRCRELVKSGVLEVIYEQVEGKGPRCAMYKLVVEQPYQPTKEEREANLQLF